MSKKVRKNYIFRADTMSALKRVQEHLGVSTETAALEVLIHEKDRSFDKKNVTLEEEEGTVWIMRDGFVVGQAFYQGDDTEEEMYSAGYIPILKQFPGLRSKLEVDELWVELGASY